MVRPIRTLGPLLGVLLTLGFVGRASATPGDTLGFGTRNINLAGAVTADVEDVGGNYYNPAGIVRGPGLRLTLSYVSMNSALEINGRDSNVERMSGITLGIVAPLRIGDFRFGFGVGVHLPDQRLSRTRSTIQSRPRWERYDTRPHKVYLSTNIAFRPIDWLLIGAGITFQSPSDLQLVIDGSADLFRVSSTRLRHQFEGDLTSTRYPQLGAQIIASDSLSFGISWRGALTLRNKLSATVDGDVVVGTVMAPLDFSLVSDSVSTYMPQQLTLGVAARPVERLRVSMDLTWMDWSKHPSLIPTEVITLEIDLSQLPVMLDIPEEIGGRSPIPMNMHDTLVPRVGIEFDAFRNDRMLFQTRLGYVYEGTPFPLQRGATNFVDSDRHTISLGAGLRLTDLEPTIPGYLQLDAYFQYAYLPTRYHQKDSLVDPVGDYRAGGQQYGFGLSLEVVFE
ncbi:MAG: outer membrane protein transport protein [Polyangiales bacterium]|nr:outer membrane protein transport protein [Myxococcales bacterium]MCB9661127.1 outer membrane protein transport protein [Sandaracinaceae bacterium]